MVMHVRKPMQATPVGFEPTRGDPIGLAGRRLNHSAKVSMTAFLGAANVHVMRTCTYCGVGHQSLVTATNETRD